MIIIDEYLAMRAVRGDLPEIIGDEDLGLPASRHWRLLQRVHAPGDGQLTKLLSKLSTADIDTIRYPHPEVLNVVDPRPLLDSAAVIASRYGGGLLIAETLAAGLMFGRGLWFGTERNVGTSLADAANDLDIPIHVLD